MKNLMFSAAAAALGFVASAAEYTITATTDETPALTGSDKLILKLPVANSVANGRWYIKGDHSDWSGTVDILCGALFVEDAKSLGTAKIVCTNSFVNYDNYVQMVVRKSMTLSNEFKLGDEKVKDKVRLFSDAGSDGLVTLTGDIFFNNTRIHTVNGSSLVFNGDLTQDVGYYLVFGENSSTTPYAERITVNGVITVNTLYTEKACTGLVINGKNQKVMYLFPTSDSTIVCGADDVFADGYTKFSGRFDQTSGGRIDLRGTTQHFGCLHQPSKETCGPLPVRNTCATNRATMFIDQVVPSNKTFCWGKLTPQGEIDITKTGAGPLSLADTFTLDGTLTINKGIMQFTGPQKSLGRAIVVNENGILDLGGNTYSVDYLKLNGGIVQNGTLHTVSNDLVSGICTATLAGGETYKTGAAAAAALGGATTYASTLKDGLVCCYHFDSAADLLKDASGNGYELENCWTNSSYKVLPSKGSVVCTNDVKRFGTGSAYFSEHVFLRYKGDGVPSKMPTGSQPFSHAFAFKLQSAGNRGLFFFGTPSALKACGMSMNGLTRIMTYLWGYKTNEEYVYPTHGETTFDDGQWHTAVHTFDGTILRIYIDGIEAEPEPCYVPETTRTKTTPLNIGTMHFYIGAGHNTTYHKGWIDEVAMWNRALTPGEVADYVAHGVQTGAPTAESAQIDVTSGSLTLSDSTAVNTITNGIVARYSFDTEDTLLKDSSGNGYDLVVTNANTTKTSTSYTAPICQTNDGQFVRGGGAAYFDGTSGFALKDGYAACTKIPRGKDPWSVAFYLRENTTGTPGIFAFGKNVRYQCVAAYFQVGTNHQFLVNYLWRAAADDNKDTVWQSDGTTLSDVVAWHAYVCTYDGTTRRWYVDGVEVPLGKYNSKIDRDAANPTAAIDLVAAHFFIGTAMNNNFLKGSIDEFTMWDRALTAEEAAVFASRGTQTITVADSADLAVAAGATVKPTSGTLTACGALVAAGSLTGDLVLKDGVTVKGEANRTMAVSGTITVEGAGTFEPLTAPTQTVKYEPFAAAGGYADGSAANLETWTAVKPEKPNFITQFRLAAEKFCVDYFRSGFMLLLR